MGEVSKLMMIYRMLLPFSYNKKKETSNGNPTIRKKQDVPNSLPPKKEEKIISEKRKLQKKVPKKKKPQIVMEPNVKKPKLKSSQTEGDIKKDPDKQKAKPKRR